MTEQTKVRLCIVSRMRDDEGQTHEIKNAHRGLLRKTPQGVILEYDEDHDGERAHIELTCEPKRAQMLRKGMTSAKLIFESGRRTSSAYVTLYGEIPVAVDTRRIDLLSDEAGGRLTLDYALYVGGDKTADTLLKVIWRV